MNEAFLDNHPMLVFSKKEKEKTLPKREKKNCFLNCLFFFILFSIIFSEKKIELFSMKILLKEQKNSLSPNERKVFFP